MFGKRKPEAVTFRGLMPRLFGEVFGGEIEYVLIDPRGMVILNAGNVALKYSQTGFELAVKKTGNEVYDAILGNLLEKEFKAIGEGEGVYTAKVEAEFGLLKRVRKVLGDADKEYRELLGKLKKKK